jgi:hypothetical protein
VEINGNMPKLTIIRKSGQKADKNNWPAIQYNIYVHSWCKFKTICYNAV